MFKFKGFAVAVAAAVVVAGLAVGGGRVSAGDGKAPALECGLVHGVLDCIFISDSGTADYVGKQFTVDVGGTTYTVDVANPSIRRSASCGNTEGTCWGLLFFPPQPPAGTTTTDNADDSDNTDDGGGLGYPCPDQPALTCIDDLPTGDGATTITVVPGTGDDNQVNITTDGNTASHETPGFVDSEDDFDTTDAW
ncbi:MAG: hypothetical protein F4Y28_03960 [Acidimicrobiia bacterium]|nr:hypothetical protein [Acidimicrobiia bacterium]MYG57634.1 hypothetical protein [Acidimicrobiia bacterium]MYJ31297.1 hypothetical protein [Acidimicrobiia bacterium]